MEVFGTTDPETILQAALAHGERVTRFEIADPSIEQIFVERVGKSTREETSLAGPTELPAAALAGAADRSSREGSR
jgi:hypothetical protein